MGLGVSALQRSLVGDLGLGDQLVRVSAEPAVHAHAGNGRQRRPVVVVRLWTGVGNCRPDQYGRDFVPALLGVLARLPFASSPQTHGRTFAVERGGLLAGTHTVAGTQLLG